MLEPCFCEDHQVDVVAVNDVCNSLSFGFVVNGSCVNSGYSYLGALYGYWLFMRVGFALQHAVATGNCVTRC